LFFSYTPTSKERFEIKAIAGQGHDEDAHGKDVEALLLAVVRLLAADQPLPSFNRDHALIGEWCDHRDCHLKPDLVLMYRKTQDGFLDLVRLGSHSGLGM
jgi:mRNA interferase YafQ